MTPVTPDRIFAQAVARGHQKSEVRSQRHYGSPRQSRRRVRFQDGGRDGLSGAFAGAAQQRADTRVLDPVTPRTKARATYEEEERKEKAKNEKRMLKDRSMLHPVSFEGSHGDQGLSQPRASALTDATGESPQPLGTQAADYSVLGSRPLRAYTKDAADAEQHLTAEADSRISADSETSLNGDADADAGTSAEVSVYFDAETSFSDAADVTSKGQTEEPGAALADALSGLTLNPFAEWQQFRLDLALARRDMALARQDMALTRQDLALARNEHAGSDTALRHGFAEASEAAALSRSESALQLAQLRAKLARSEAELANLRREIFDSGRRLGL